jgi:hypothetical protein
LGRQHASQRHCAADKLRALQNLGLAHTQVIDFAPAVELTAFSHIADLMALQNLWIDNSQMSIGPLSYANRPNE